MRCMTTMRALAQTQFGGPDVIEELTLPVPEATGRDLRVRVHAVGINPVDVKVRSNWNGFGDLQAATPVVTGWDVSGVVDAVGPAADGRFQVGDAVFFAGSVARQGSHREYTLVDSRVVGRKPKRLTFAQAAAMPLTSLTVWEGLVDHAGVRVDAGGLPKTVLIVGGAGGVGSIGIQLMKRVAGLRVVATASRAESVAFCKKMGADLVIDHTRALRPQLEAAGIAEVDYVLHTSEPDDNFDEIAAFVAPLGRIVCILPIGRPVDTGVLFARSISLVYELMFTRGLFQIDLARQGEILDKVSALVDAGTLDSHLVDTFPWTLEGLRAAHERIESRRGLGKAVLSLREL
jgi:zinc-binding alcohol dehydrogenase family protein